MTRQALQGIRVLDLCGEDAGHNCPTLLARCGAQVIRVDGLPGGSRFAHERVQIDLGTSDGAECLRLLALQMDVIVGDPNLPALSGIDLTYGALAADNPRLIHATLSDAQAQARTDITPATASFALCFDVLAALREVEATGKGRQIDLSLKGCADRCQPPVSAGGSLPETADGLAQPGKPVQVAGQSGPSDANTQERQRALRDAFGHFATGVTVVTTRQPDGTPRGFTANSFSSVSLDPPLLLICIGKAALSCDSFVQSTHFAVNILADDQKDISGLFASRSSDKFELAGWHPDAQDMPIIDGALASFSCAQHRLVDAGDHLILIGRVVDFATREGQPLGYYKGAYFDIGLDRAVTDAAATGRVAVGAVLANKDRVLLCVDTENRVSVPVASSADALIADLARGGLTPELAHLYAVYEVSQSGVQRVIYHGQVTGDAPAGMAYFDIADLPLARVKDKAERAMLRRYMEENAHGAFGFYHGSEVEGLVHTPAGHRNYMA